MASNPRPSTVSRKKPIWDWVTISLAIAVLLLTIIICLLPRTLSPVPRTHSTPVPVRHLPRTMA